MFKKHKIKSHENLELMLKDYDSFYKIIAEERFIVDNQKNRKVYDLKEAYGSGSIESQLLSPTLMITLYNYELNQDIVSDFDLSLDYFELEYCLEGSMIIELDDVRKVFKENEVSISLNSKMSGKIIRKQNHHYRGVSIVASKNFIKQFFGNEGYQMWNETINTIEDKSRFDRYFGLETSREIAVAFRQIAECRLPESMKPLYFESKVMEILTMIISEEIIKREDYKRTDISPFEIEQIKKIPKILMNYRFDLLSIKELSDLLGLREDKMTQGFKILYNDTIMNYHRKNVLRIGADMLLRGNESVNEIADYLAYASASSFIHAFKKEYGVTPHKYRESSILNSRKI